MFRMHSIQDLSASMSYSWGMVYVWRDLAYLEVLNVSHAVDHVLRLFTERIERAILLQVCL